MPNMPPLPQYGSICKDGDEDLDVELLATPHVGDVYATGDECGGIEGGWGTRRRSRRGVACALVAAIVVIACLLSSSRQHEHDVGGKDDVVGGDGVGGGRRVPMPPPLSDLDPASDLGFRIAIRTGDALPSMAWGEHRRKMDSDGNGGYAPLPTNQWYLVSSFRMVSWIVRVHCNLPLFSHLPPPFPPPSPSPHATLNGRLPLFRWSPPLPESPIAPRGVRPIRGRGGGTRVHHPVRVGRIPPEGDRIPQAGGR